MRTNNLQYLPDIEDQAQEGSCTCNSTTTALEMTLKKASRWVDLSRQFPYYNARNMEGRLSQEGDSLLDVLRSIQTLGVCTEATWPYLKDNENVKPTDTAYAEAWQRRITGYEEIKLSPDNPWAVIKAIKAALAQGLPVVISMPLSECFRQMSGPLEQQNYIPVSVNNPYIGAHSVVLIDDYPDMSLGSFIGANSWGTGWGFNGLFRFGYSFVMDLMNAYVITGFDGIEVPYIPYDPMPQVDYPAAVTLNSPFTWTVKNGIPYSSVGFDWWYGPSTQMLMPQGQGKFDLDANGEYVGADSYKWLWPATHRFVFRFADGSAVTKTIVVSP